MKNKLMVLVFALGITFVGCGKDNVSQKPGGEVVQVESMPIETVIEEDIQTEEAKADEVEQTKELDDTIYIGEYLDCDNQEPNLEIAKGEDGKYIVQIGIFRLTTLSDGVGELTEEGMLFTATDMAGNPISGIITVENQIATVEFTDSTWELLETGACFQYTKSSDEPNIWEE